MNTEKLPERVKRNTEGIKCTCGGYMDLVESTPEEIKVYGCFRDSPTWRCCAYSFVCCLCGRRVAGTAEAPDME